MPAAGRSVGVSGPLVDDLATELLEVVTPPELAPRWRRRRTRGRCYQLAFCFLEEHADVRGLTLEHGVIVSPVGIDIGHARVEATQHGLVFDGVAQRFYATGAYYDLRGARSILSFDLTHAIGVRLSRRYFGPWHAEHVI